jgi:hypothetical protein
MFGWFKKKPQEEAPKTDWRLVHTKSSDVQIRVSDGTRVSGVMYFYLFESDLGTRKWEGACTVPNVDCVFLAGQMAYYHETVYPWLRGRYVPGILQYNEVEAADVQKKLST